MTSAPSLDRLAAWLNRIVPLKLEALNVAAGIRAALACALPVLVGELLNEPSFSWVAVIAFWGCLADMGGAWRTRLLSTGGFTLFATVGASLGGLVGGEPWIAVPLAFVWCFAFSLIRVLGSEAGTVGLLASLSLLVPLGLPEASGLARAEQLAVLTFGGGLWSMLLALAVWRIYPYGPARAAVAGCWQSLARFAAALGTLEAEAAAPDALPGELAAERWARIGRERRRECREAIEAGRRVLLATRRSRAGSSARGQALLLLLSEADQLFGALLGVSELIELAGSGDRRDIPAETALGRSLLTLGERVDAVADEIRGRFRTGPARAQSDQDLRGLIGAALAAGPSYRHGAELTLRADDIVAGAAEALPSLQRLGAPTTVADAARPPVPAFRERLLGVLQQTVRVFRANLRRDSLPFRHALRLAATAAAAVLATALIGSERGYWVTLTAITVLQPYMAATWQRTLERVAGSVAGGIVAAFIGAFIHQPVAVAVLIFPLSVLTLALRGVNYTLYVIFLTPSFVLVAELFEGSLGHLDLAALRALDSVLGGILGLAAAFFLWPSWERSHLPEQLARAVKANRDYLDRALADPLRAAAGPVRETAEPDIETVRRGAGLASNNAEASLQRLIGEPSARDNHRIEPAMAVLDGLRRLAGIAATLTLLPRDVTGAEGAAAELQAIRPWMDEMLAQTATTLRGDTVASPDATTAPSDPPGRPGAGLLREELTRLRRQVDLVAAAARRFAGETPAADAL